MPSTSAPFGFRPSFHNSGQMRPKAYTIASTYATNIFSGDPVKLVDAGTVQLGTSVATYFQIHPAKLGAFAATTHVDAEDTIASLKAKIAALEKSKGAAPTSNKKDHKHYCWTHGTTQNHTSADCKKRSLDHKATATASNQMGGNPNNFRADTASYKAWITAHP